jgi:fatty acid desaturase
MLFRFAHYSFMNLLLACNIVLLSWGGAWTWVGFIGAVVISSVVDEAAGDDLTDHKRAPVRFLNLMLWLTLPLIAANVVMLALVAGRSGIADLPSLLGTILAVGIYTGGAATNVAHELIHRNHSPWQVTMGRWLLAFSFDTSFSIEHVHGHHRRVCTPDDPATARRGEYVLAFAWRSFRDGNRSAMRIEAERLKRKGLPFWSTDNQFISGQMMSLALMLAAIWIGGWVAGLAFLLAGLQGKMYLELVNYIEHYGLVRVPGQRIEARHAWNTYRRISSGLLYNLPRHSHHHLYATKPFWTLEPEPEGPTYPHGYMTMMIISLVPPWWNSVVEPRLATWDQTMANPAEREIIAGTRHAA